MIIVADNLFSTAACNNTLPIMANIENSPYTLLKRARDDMVRVLRNKWHNLQHNLAIYNEQHQIGL